MAVKLRRPAAAIVFGLLAWSHTGCAGGGDDEVVTSPEATTTTDVAHPSPEPTEPPPATDPEVVLTWDGLGVVAVGDERDPAVAALTERLGAPTAVAGPVPAASGPFGVCAGDQLWAYEWGPLRVLFSDGERAGVGAVGPRLLVVYYGAGGREPDGEPPVVLTDRGITLGSTLADLRRAYGAHAVEVYEDEGRLVYFEAGPEDRLLSGYLSTADGSGVVQSLVAGSPCGE